MNVPGSNTGCLVFASAMETLVGSSSLQFGCKVRQCRRLCWTYCCIPMGLRFEGNNHTTESMLPTNYPGTAPLFVGGHNPYKVA